MNRPLLVAALLSLTGCLDIVSPREAERLRDAERRWEQANLDDYSFEMRTSCFCPPEIYEWAIVEVIDGQVVSARTLDGKLLSGYGLSSRRTVEGLFAEAHARYSWIEDIDFEFDDTLGYPVRVEHQSKRNIADAGATFEARNLVPLLTQRP